MKKQPYLTSAQLAEELQKSQELGHPTEKACEYFKLIATRLLGDSRYRRYPKDLQEDMVSSALEKCVRNIRNYKAEYADRCFNYYVRCAEHAFWQVLNKYYKQVNIRRQLALEYADKIERENPLAAQVIRDAQLEVRHTGELAIRPGWKRSGR